MRHSNLKMPGLGMGIVAILLAGCGSSGEPSVVVRGKVTKGGDVMPVKPMVGRLRVTFHQVKDNPKELVDPKEARINFEDGTFVVDGGNGKGISPGTYKIAVTWQDDFPTGKDKLDGKFTREKTQILREVKENNQEIILDVSKAEG